jgi:hypothetical protein
LFVPLGKSFGRQKQDVANFVNRVR